MNERGDVNHDKADVGRTTKVMAREVNRTDVSCRILTSIAVLRVWILTLADSSRPYSFISVILPVSPSTP